MQYKGRIDIRVEGNKFNLSHVRAGGTLTKPQLFKANWLLSKDQEKHWVVSGDLERGWAELCIEFVAGGKGNLSLEFRGGWFDDLDINRHEVWLDDVELDGGSIVNGSFEEVDKDNRIVGWEEIKTYNNEDVRARTGKRCVMVWHQEPAVQKVFVKPGKKYKVSAWFRPNDV